MNLLENLESRSRWFIIAACLGFVAVIGLVDFLTGFEMFFSVFYLLAVGVATWFVGRSFGFFMSFLSAAAWMTGDLAAGARFSKAFIPVWNVAILLAFYSIVVWLLASLRELQRDLENRVRARTVSLTEEMAECARLEKEILEVSEREQRRIGHDLHDSLCQHLTATALAGKVLEEKLAAKSLPETADASNVVELVEDGISLARSLARGISPVEMAAEGIITAFQELAANIARMSKITCVFESDARVSIPDAATATHLYRMTQEAVSNALRHGKAKRIDISLVEYKNRITLTVEDDGLGLPETWQKNQGLGTRIMAHRAAMIGATFSLEPNPTGGTLVNCSFPVAASTQKESQPSRA